MKKIVLFACAVLSAFTLASCKGKDAPAASSSILTEKLDLSKKVDASNWLDNLADGKIAAQQADKKIILFFSADDQDVVSAALKKTLLTTPDFLQAATAKYVLVNLDFSNELYEQSLEDEALSAKLEANMKIATVYGVQMSPAFYLLTKEGYVITELQYDGMQTAGTVASFEEEIDAHAEEIVTFETAYAKTTAGTDEEKVQAIDALYELIDQRQTYVFAPLASQVITLDPKNKTGLVGKYVLAVADAEATDAALNNDPETMVAVFEKAAKNKFLNGDEKQQAYYYAGYFLAGSGNPDYDKIKDYIQKSYNAAPESERAPQIANLLTMIDQRMQETAEMNENVQVEGAKSAATDAPAGESADDTAANTITLE